MYRLSVIFAFFIVAVTTQGHGQIGVLNTEPIEPPVRQMIEISATTDNCRHYKGPNSCIVSFLTLQLPQGGKIVRLTSKPDDIVKAELVYGLPAHAYSGIEISMNSDIRVRLLANPVKIQAVYEGPAIR